VLTAPVTYLRMVFVLLGAGIALALAILDVTVVALLIEGDAVPLVVLVVLAALIVVVPVAGLGLVPGVREVEATAARTLLHVRFADGVPGPALTWADRRRTLVWFVLHLLAGAVVVAMVVGALVAGLSALGLVAAAAAVVVCSGLGYALGLVAPGLLGPSYDERVARLESETARLAERNRLAREIHDGVGHALSLVTVQAAAAKRVVHRDADFVVAALDAIEQASRSAANDLDHVLGLLRDGGDAGARAPAPDLRALDSLVAASRAAGLDVEVRADGDLAGLPALVSREGYRIAQEALTNAMRHSADGRAALGVEVGSGELTITVTNAPAARERARGGRGLAGIAERAAMLEGTAEHGVVDGAFRLVVSLPSSARAGS